jgi:hypothetical protein
MRGLLLAAAEGFLCLTLTGGEARAAEPLVEVLSPAGDRQSAPHGRGNIYAPDVMVEGGRYRMWFGGQGRDGHDRIQLAESGDGLTWQSRGVVLEDRDANHVNDPSVVKVGTTYFMYYTRAGSDVRDDIALATSEDGVVWAKKGVVLRPTAAGAWDSLLVGRPSVLVEGGLFRMWYDGRKDLPPDAPAENVPKSSRSVRAVGYAESRDGYAWERAGKAPVFGGDAGGVHVTRVGDGYAMVYESRDGTRLAIGTDGRTWAARGVLVARSGGDADAFGHVTPFLLTGPGRKAATLFVGAARSKSWDQNSIARVTLTPTQLRRIGEP